MRKGQSRALLTAAEKTEETQPVQVLRFSKLTFFPNSNFNAADTVLFNNLYLPTPASFTRRPDAHCTVPWVSIIVGGEKKHMWYQFSTLFLK